MTLFYTLSGFIIAIIILVTIHEMGHFYVARWCGVKVLRFCIGFGKPFITWKDKHGTEFGLAPFPLGGYVKMLDEREGEVPESERHTTFNQKTIAQRIAILAAGPIANFLLAMLLFACIAWSRGAVDIVPQIGLVTPQSLADRAGLKVGQEIVAVDGQSVTSVQQVMEQLFRRLGETGELSLAVTTPDTDVITSISIPLQAWLADQRDPDPVKGLGFDFYQRAVVMGEPAQDSVAARAGLQAEDTIQRLNGKPVENIQALIQIIRQSPDKSLDLTVQRQGETLHIAVTPQLKTLDDGSQAGQIGVPLGYGPWPEALKRIRSFNVYQGVIEGVANTWQTSVMVLISVKKLFVGEISTKNLSGPIGIAKVAGDHARAGLGYFVEFLAVLSVYLGVLNFLPIPILDGGQIVYHLAEALKGRALSERIQTWGYGLGLVFLVSVTLVALYNDLLRL